MWTHALHLETIGSRQVKPGQKLFANQEKLDGRLLKKLNIDQFGSISEMITLSPVLVQTSVSSSGNFCI